MSRLHTTNLGSLVSVNGIQVPKGCSTLSITYQDTSDSDSGRSPLTGSMWKGYIGTLRTLKCSWNSLYPDHTRKILQAVKGLNRFPVQFYDPESGEYVTADFYVGDRQTDIKTFWRNHELIGLSLTLIENDPYADGNGDTGEGGGIVPEGTVTLTNNGLHEVTKYEMADVKVPPYGEGEVQIKTNGRHSVSGKAVAVVNVPAGGGGITPSGTIEIDSNGKHDVTDYAEADVQVPPYGVGETSISSNGDHDVSGKATAKVNVPPYGIGEIEINDNGRIDVSGKATAVVNVPKGINPEGKITITENGVKDVTAYAQADVQVPPYGEGDAWISSNGVHDVSGKAYAHVEVEAASLDMSDPDVVYRVTRPADWMPMPDPEPDSVYMLCVGPDVAYVAIQASSVDATPIPVSIGVVNDAGEYEPKADLSPAKSGKITKYNIDLQSYNWAMTAGDDKQIMIRIMSGLKSFKAAKYSDAVYGQASGIVDVALSQTNITELSLREMTSIRYAYIDAKGQDNSVNLSNCFSSTNSQTQLVCVRRVRCVASNLQAFVSGCRELLAINLTELDTSYVKIMSTMFGDCTSLQSVDVSGFNTSSVTDMKNMFSGCVSLKTVDVSGFDMSHVTDVSMMFNDCASLTSIDISMADLSSVSRMSGFVQSCSNLRRLTFNLSIVGWTGSDFDLNRIPMSLDALRDMIDSLPTISEQHTIGVQYMHITDSIPAEYIESAAAKNWVIDTGTSTVSELDIPDAQALAIITGEEV